MRCNESLVGMATLAMHNQQVTAITTNNMIPTLEVKLPTNNTKFQTPNVPPKENTIEVSIICSIHKFLNIKLKYCIHFFLFIIIIYMYHLGYDSGEERI